MPLILKSFSWMGDEVLRGFVFAKASEKDSNTKEEANKMSVVTPRRKVLSVKFFEIPVFTLFERDM